MRRKGQNGMRSRYRDFIQPNGAEFGEGVEHIAAQAQPHLPRQLPCMALIGHIELEQNEKILNLRRESSYLPSSILPHRKMHNPPPNRTQADPLLGRAYGTEHSGGIRQRHAADEMNAIRCNLG